MGFQTALGIANSDLPLEQQVRWHLTSNCYPPVPEIMVPVAVEAITAIRSGNTDDEVTLPEGVTFRGSSVADVYEIVDALHLGAFTITADNPWNPTEDGYIICVDCLNEYEKQDILGDPNYSDPRCEECYYENK